MPLAAIGRNKAFCGIHCRLDEGTILKVPDQVRGGPSGRLFFIHPDGFEGLTAGFSGLRLQAGPVDALPSPLDLLIAAI